MFKHYLFSFTIVHRSFLSIRSPVSHGFTPGRAFTLADIMWIQTFLTDRTRRVVLDGVSFEPWSVTSDVTREVHSVTTYHYRFCPSRDSFRTTMWYTMIFKPNSYANHYMMTFHPNKCNTLHVHRKRNAIIYEYSLKGHIIYTDANTKYLGVRISHSLSRNYHVNKTVKKGNSTIDFLRLNLRMKGQERALQDPRAPKPGIVFHNLEPINEIPNT